MTKRLLYIFLLCLFASACTIIQQETTDDRIINRYSQYQEQISDGLSNTLPSNNNSISEETEDLVSEIKQENPTYEELLELGNQQYARKQYKEALISYTRAIKLEPRKEVTYSRRGNVEQGLKQYQKAIEDYNKAIELNPKYAIAYSNRGNAKQYFELYEDAILDYNKAIELDPNISEFYYNRGNAERMQKKYKKSIDDYTKAIELDNDTHSEYYSGRASSLYNLSKCDEARDDAKKAISINSNDDWAFQDLGLCDKYYEKFDDAIENLEHSISIDDKHMGPLFSLALAYEGKYYENNDRELLIKAIECYDRLIALYDGSPSSKSTYYEAHIRRGNVKSALKRYYDAIEDFSEAIELDPDAIPYTMRGDAYWQLKEFNLAIEDYNMAIALNPYHENAINGRGLTYYALKQYEEATADALKAIELNLSIRNILFLILVFLTKHLLYVILVLAILFILFIFLLYKFIMLLISLFSKFIIRKNKK